MQELDARFNGLGRGHDNSQKLFNLRSLTICITHERKIPLRFATFIVITVLLMFALAWAAITPSTFFSSDVGLRFLQVHELVEQNSGTFAIRYPARSVDPHLAHVPYYYAYSVLNGEIYFNISPFFPWLTAQLVALFGVAGLPVVPALSSVAASWAFSRLIHLSKFPYARFAFFVALLATPLLFYGIVLWDHSLGTALALWAVVGVASGLQHQRLPLFFLGGVAAGLALGQRPELYLFGAALGLTLLLLHWRRWQGVSLFALGGLLGAVPIWWLQWQWVGHPLGMALAPHLLGYGTPDHFPISSRAIPWLTKVTRFVIHTEPGSPLLGWAAVGVLGGGLLLIATFIIVSFDFRQRAWIQRTSKLGMISSILLLCCGYLLLAWIARRSALIGIIATLPLFPFIVIHLRKKRAVAGEELVYPLVLWTAICFLVGIIVTWPGYGGLQWGARYLLPLYPLLLYLAWYGYTFYSTQHQARETWGWQLFVRNGAIVLVVVSLLVQDMGVYRVFVDHGKHGEIRENLLAMPGDLILTNHVFMPSFMTAVTADPQAGKAFVYVRNEAVLHALLPTLLTQGIERVGVIPRSRQSFPTTPQVEGYRTTIEVLPGRHLIYQVYHFTPEELHE